VASWPSGGTLGGGGATTSSRAPNNSGGDLCLALVRVEVPAKDSGGSLGPTQSYQLNWSVGLSARGRWPTTCLL
jgi:hypothetical protein